MTENESVPFDLIRAPLAKKKYNISYDDSDFDGTAKFQVVISNDCPDNVEDCIDSNGTLKSGFSTTVLGDIKLQLVEYSDYSSEIMIKEDTTFNIASDIDVKGIFLRKKSSPNFVLGYSIMLKPVRFCDKLILEADNVLWTITG